MLDGMDTQMLSFVIPTLVATWGISLADAGFIGTITLLASAAGGWIAGILSDRIGRVRTLQLTVLWFAVFTALCGSRRTTTSCSRRALMGFGFGGEWTAGAVLIGEVIRARDRGRAVGLVQSGWAIGWGCARCCMRCCSRCCRPSRRGARCSSSASRPRCWSSRSVAT